MSDGRQQFHGPCHCGNIRFVFVTDKTDGELPKRECSCTFCRQHGGTWTSDPDGELRVSVAEAEQVNKYRFGHRTADFHVCRNCGGVPVVTCEDDGETIGVLNVRMIEDFAWSREETAGHDFDDEEVDARLSRRARNWIGTVTFGSPTPRTE
jgi:hypothetical protein